MRPISMFRQGQPDAMQQDIAKLPGRAYHEFAAAPLGDAVIGCG